MPLEKFKQTGHSGFLPRGGGAHALETQDIKAFGRPLGSAPGIPLAEVITHERPATLSYYEMAKMLAR